MLLQIVTVFWVKYKKKYKIPHIFVVRIMMAVQGYGLQYKIIKFSHHFLYLPGIYILREIYI